MARAFSIRDFMNADVRQQEWESDVYEKVSVYDIQSNPKNEYGLSEIEKMKDSIYALGGVQQNVVLVRCPEGEDHKYLALDGHRRLTASRELVEEGYREFEFIPAVIKGQIDADTEDAVLVMMNSTQRNKTDWEKVMEHMKLKEVIPRLKKRNCLDGRTRDIESDLLGVSHGQISIYNTIGTRLNAELMELFRNGSIGISLAFEVAKEEPDIQKRLAGLAHDNGSISEEDIKRLTDSRPIKGQIRISEVQRENVSESGTSEKARRECIPVVQIKENVPESGTSEKKPNECASDVAEGKKEENVQAEAVENVSESDTYREQMAAVDSSLQIKFRGGYDLVLVDELISQYTSCLEVAVPNNRENQICRYNCLLDALDLLHTKLAAGGGNEYDL